MSDVGRGEEPRMETDRDNIENQRPPPALGAPGVGETLELAPALNTEQVGQD